MRADPPVGTLIKVAPGAGPVTLATVRQTPAPASATARSRACAPSRPGTRRWARSRTRWRRVRRVLARGQRLAQPGQQRHAAGSRSLLSSGPSSAGSPERSAAISALSKAGGSGTLTVPTFPRLLRLPALLGGAHAIARRVHIRCRQPAVGERQHPVERTGGEHGGHLLAPSDPYRCPAQQAERNIAAEVPDASSHSSFWLRPVPHSSLHATRVAAASALPPAKPAATGIRLVIWIASPGASREPCPTAPGAAPSQLGRQGWPAIRRHAVGPFTGDAHTVALRRGDGHLIE